MTLSCTPEMVGEPVNAPSPLPEGPVGGVEPPPQASGPSASAPAPVDTPLALPTRPTRRDTVISPPTTTTSERPLVLDEEVTPGPTEIELMPVEYVLDWRPEVSVWFKAADVDRVLSIIHCESSGRWNAASKRPADNGMHAQGLMQHLDGYWPSRAKRAAAAGYTNHGDIWSPIDQIAVSAWLAYNTPQGFGHWVCDPGGQI